ncbi:hypothetical protein [Jatrophihabitans sp.]|uniref:hypothetical protein n=1 Tax=Jatrophihabitans sp. TaxID=1932789 RepID=UPI002F132436
MTISAAQWRARRLTGAGVSPGEARAAQPDPVGASSRQQRRYARAERAGTAAAVNDRLLDAVVLLSVVVFLVLAFGAGMLVLQSALHG